MVPEASPLKQVQLAAHVSLQSNCKASDGLASREKVDGKHPNTQALDDKPQRNYGHICVRVESEEK